MNENSVRPPGVIRADGTTLGIRPGDPIPTLFR